MKDLVLTSAVSSSPKAGRASPHPSILILTGLLGLVSVIILKGNPTAVLEGASMGILVVSLLPWLVVLRRILWRKQFAAAGGWLTAASFLLWVSLFIGPVVTGSFGLWTRFVDAPDGMARSSDGIGLVVFGVISFTASYWLALVAFLIQLWRDHWRPRLTLVVAAYLLLLFLAFCWSVLR